MHTHSISQWQHDHTFGQDKAQSAERRTLLVIGITATMMVVEIIKRSKMPSITRFLEIQYVSGLEHIMKI